MVGTPHFVVDVLPDGRTRWKVYVGSRLVDVRYDDAGLTCWQRAGDPCISVHAHTPTRKPHRQRVTRATVNKAAKRVKRRQAKTVRRVPEQVRAAVLERAGGQCEARSKLPTLACSGRIHLHHVLRRSQGGSDTVANLLAVCSTHHHHIHGFPEHAYQLGLLRKRAPRRVA